MGQEFPGSEGEPPLSELFDGEEVTEAGERPWRWLWLNAAVGLLLVLWRLWEGA
jgi:hypothetical protein